MITTWYQVAYQSVPVDPKPWVVLKCDFSSFNGVMSHKVVQRCESEGEARSWAESMMTQAPRA